MQSPFERFRQYAREVDSLTYVVKGFMQEEENEEENTHEEENDDDDDDEEQEKEQESDDNMENGIVLKNSNIIKVLGENEKVNRKKGKSNRNKQQKKYSAKELKRINKQ
ncbi:MAG: hypothetical protein EZS28_054156, partial [Streblomastix strix]